MPVANFCGIAALVIWSATAVLIVGTGEMPPFLLGAVTFFIGFAVTFAIEKLRGSDLKRLRGLSWRVYLFGFFGVGVHTLFLYYGFKNAPPFAANTLNYVWPILLAVFVSLLEKRKLRIENYAGLLLGFAGAVLLFSGRGGANTDYSLWGYFSAFMAGLVWAIYSATARRVAYPAAATGVFFLMTAILSLAAHLLFEETIWPDNAGWMMAAALGIGRIAYTMWDYAMKQGDQELLASLSYFVPLLSTLILVFFGFVPSAPATLLAGVMIITGCLAANFRKILPLCRRLRKK